MTEAGSRRGRDRSGAGRPGTRRVGMAVASVPVLLFGLSILFVTVTDRSPGGCDHDHPRERVRDWWRSAVGEDVSTAGTRYVALDDSVDCIRVGIEDPRVRAHLERRFRRLGIPSEVVLFDVVEPGDGGG